MAQSQALLGYDSKLEVSTNAGSTYTEIAEAYNISPPSREIAEVEVTHMQTPDRTREYIPGLTDSGSASCEMNYIPGSAVDLLLETLRVNATVALWRITYANGAVETFSGSVQTYERDAPTDDRMTATLAIKVSGNPTMTPAAAPTNQALPAVSGVLTVGQTLTALEGAWTGAVSFTYVWQRNTGSWAAIAGATSRTYTLVVADETRPIRVLVTGVNPAGTLEQTSAATPAVGA